MPTNTGNWDALSAWFNAWLSADASGRETVRAELADKQPHLLAEADALAMSSRHLSEFLETPALLLAARELADDDPLLSPGSMMGPYRVVSPLGRGGTGDVYRATDVRLHRDVALKVVAQTRLGEPQRLDRFMHEARSTASLDHPNIVRVYDVGQVNDRAYLVTELLEGETLRARIARGAMPDREVLPIAIEIARGLGAAHEAGLVHRDLKPENIFLVREGNAKILDFGIAKLAQDDTLRDGFATLTGVVLGTTGYLAPEQIRGERIGPSADLFGLGAVLFEMLTGTRAYAREHLVETLYAILHDPPDGALAEREDVPPALSRIVLRLLEKSPDARFQSCADLIAALEGVDMRPGRDSTPAQQARPQQPIDLPASSAWRGHHARWAVLALVGIATTGLLTAWYGGSTSPASRVAGGAREDVSQPGTRNPDAFEAYLQGRAYAMKATGAELARAVSLFERAVTLDPSYADAWAGLASAYRRMPVGGDVLPAMAFEQARNAASQALRIDARHAEAHATLGSVAFWYDWDFDRAEALLRRALELQPDSADTHVFLAHLFSNLGRHSEAIGVIRRARALDPGWPVARSLEGQFLFLARRYEEALELFDALVQIEPRFPTARVMRVYPLLALQRYEEALSECARALELRREVDSSDGVYSWGAGLQGYALARMGRTAEAQAILDELGRHRRGQYVSPYGEALVLHGLGRDAAALARLQAAVEVRDHRVTFLGVDPKWDALRSSPAFRQLLSRVNLLEVSEQIAR